MNVRQWWQRIYPPVLIFLMITLSAELVVRMGWVPKYLMPAPSTVLLTLWNDGRVLGWAAGSTFAGALAGFSLSVVAGITLAVALSASRWVERGLYPYAVFFQTVPIIAIAPLLVIWFGYGQRTVIASAFIVSVFPVIANTLSGLKSTDVALLDLFGLYRASRWATLLKLRLPYALPAIFTGLRIAAGLAVIGAIVGEFIAGGGLGSAIDASRTQQRVDRVFACVLLAAVLGLTMFSLINACSRWVLRSWHPSEAG